MYQITINIKQITINIKKDEKNKETLEAIEETNRILQNLEEYQTYNDVDSMMIDILSEK